ncbi:MAG: YidC/Oxa1 family membrane protein insertase [Clostridia bacterium]|nr:YidC/Oxa1 family membrane protein insertase [Clostridia bacterium]
MELFNLLNGSVGIHLFGQTFDVSLNWIGELIKGLIKGVGSVGLGIIVFSLILKVIVLPFDIYQRIAMRKQNLKMAENKDRMEKLQKQYANDKQMYNQKVMEMYKESGINMFSSCLPMILSMIIFFVAIGAFNSYSQYSNIENYNIMVDAYNAKMTEYAVDVSDENTNFTLQTRTEKNAQGVDEEVYYIQVSQTAKVIYFEVKYTGEIADMATYKAYVDDYKGEKAYYIDKAKLDDTVKAYVEEKRTAHNNANAESGATTPFDEDLAIKTYFIEQGQDAVVSAYKKDVTKNTSFLWIKNIWVTDAVYKHPVLPYGEFSSSMARESFKVDGKKVKLSDVAEYTNAYQEYAYDQITGKLDSQKSAPNGYFILIALSIGSILLQQFVSMRSQKEQQKYSSVDGQSGSQQKMMLIMMTGMFAIFSFLYSSAFTIYMVTSNLTSLASTLIINKAVDSSARKKEERALQEKYNKRFPRQQQDDKKKKK